MGEAVCWENVVGTWTALARQKITSMFLIVVECQTFLEVHSFTSYTLISPSTTH